MPNLLAEKPAPTSTNRRVTFRYLCGVHASCEPVAARGKSGLEWQARVKDVSRGGLGLLLDRRFEKGTVLTVELALDPHGSCMVLARVVHAMRLPDGDWLVGCELVNRQAGEEVVQNWEETQ
jgi:hypothetical protein